jgi:AraC-like DNA-binding protein
MEEHTRILAERLKEPGMGIVSDVRQAILEALPENPSAGEVSDGVRSELAKEYLSDCAVRIPDVAFRLGFSERSSFKRAFRRWTGKPPSRWREKTS